MIQTRQHGTVNRKLRCFVHHQNSIRCVRLLGSGKHGAVVLAVIERAQYALRVVTLPGTHWCTPSGLTCGCSSKKWKPPGPVFHRYDQAIYRVRLHPRYV
jgi:hypothetical protein